MLVTRRLRPRRVAVGDQTKMTTMGMEEGTAAQGVVLHHDNHSRRRPRETGGPVTSHRRGAAAASRGGAPSGDSPLGARGPCFLGQPRVMSRLMCLLLGLATRSLRTRLATWMRSCSLPKAARRRLRKGKSRRAPGPRTRIKEMKVEVFSLPWLRKAISLERALLQSKWRRARALSRRGGL